MKTYRYTGINTTGQRVRGKQTAINEQDCFAHMKQQGVEIITLRQTSPLRSIFTPTVTVKQRMTLVLQLELLLQAGLPLLEVIEDVADSLEHPHLRDTLHHVHASMLTGQTFSQALAQHPQVFDDVFISLIQVGEQSGQLDKTLHHLTNMLKWQDELNAKAKHILTYPLIIGAVVLTVTAFMMIEVVPQVSQFIVDMNGTLPIQTQWLIATSTFMQHHWPWLVLFPLCLWLGFKYVIPANHRLKARIDRLKTQLWLIGPILLKIKIARMANVMSIMSDAGMHLPDVLLAAGRVANNDYLNQAMVNIHDAIKEGRSVHDSFKHSEVFPPLVNKLVKMGEQSGTLKEAFNHIRYLYDREANDAIHRLEPMMEPLMTLIMAIIIGWVLLSVLSPIWDSMAHI